MKMKPTISPIGAGAAVISSVVTSFGLDSDEQEFVNNELKWLFSAIDNFLKIRRGELERRQPISVPIPEEAERNDQANNQLLRSVDEFELQLWEGQVEAGLKRINIHLRNLNILLEQEAVKGPEAKGDVYLQNQIRGGRIEIVKVLQEMAQLIDQAYGILVTSPDQLIDLLA